MKKIIYAITAVALSSCSTLQIAQRENANPVQTIGLRKVYNENIPQSLQERIDSVVVSVVNQFNNEHHSFQLTPYQATDQHFITLDFSKAKLITRRHRNISYVLNGTVPLISVAAGMTMPVLLNYTPKHKINSTLVVSQGLCDKDHNSSRLRSRAGVLFSNVDVKENKLLAKYSARLYHKLEAIDSLLAEKESKHLKGKSVTVRYKIN